MSESPVIEHSAGTVARGHCLCGGVRFEVHGPLRPIIYCHCTMCRRSSGHFDAATACAPRAPAPAVRAVTALVPSSAIARRGFCGTCGSQLFWEPAHGGHMSIWAGTLDTPTGLEAVDAHLRRRQG